MDTLGTQQVIAGKMPQKPAEWSKNDTVFLNEIIDFFENKTNRLQHDLDMYAHWLKSLPERFVLQPKQKQNDYITPHKEFFKFIYDRLINVHKENPNVDYMRSFKERLNNLSFGEKQEWSEEDERIRKAILGFLNPDKGGTKYSSYAELVWWSNWLKNLHGRFNPQPKAEWSENDEKKINFLSRLIEFQVKDDEYCFGDGRLISKQEAIEMLKSLRPVSKESLQSWKPSEEQMDALQRAVNKLAKTDVADSVRLSIIYDNLKKL